MELFDIFEILLVMFVIAALLRRHVLFLKLLLCLCTLVIVSLYTYSTYEYKVADEQISRLINNTYEWERYKSDLYLITEDYVYLSGTFDTEELSN